MATVADLVINVNSRVNKAIKGLGLVVSALHIAPAAAAATAAVGGIAAGAVAAGAGIGAFAAAAKPAVDEVTNAFKLQEAAVAASAQGGTAATAAQKKYNEAVKGLSGPQKGLLTQFTGLNKEYKAWSKGLEGTTVPVFSKGIRVLRNILPQLTPFVKSAGAALQDFVGDLEKGSKSAGFKKFMADLAKFSGPALKDFLNSAKNIAVGFGGLISAFLPMSGKMTGGLESMTASFARWGQSLKGSNGFAQFEDMANAGGGSLKQLALSVGQLLSDLSPLIKAASGLSLAFAKLVAATPVPVLVTIGKVLLAVKAALMAYRAYVLIVTTATRVWTAVQAAWTAVMAANPIILIVAAIAILIAAIVYIATKTTWFQTAWKYTWNAIKAVGLAIWSGLKTAFSATINFFVSLWNTVSGAIKSGWNSTWNWVKTTTRNIWNGIKSFFSNVFNFLKMLFLNFTGPGLIIKHWNTIKNATTKAWNAVKNFVSNALNSIKNFITSKTSAAKNAAVNAFNFIKTSITNAINRTWNAVNSAIGKIQSKVSGIKSKVMSALRGAATWLYNSGKKIIQGLINGIKNMAGRVGDAVKSVLKKARDLLPFSPAKTGPFSGHGYTTYSGQAMMQDWARGIQSRGNAPVKAMTGVALATSQASATPKAKATAASGDSAMWSAVLQELRALRAQRAVLEIDPKGGDDELIKLIRKWIRTKGRGNVQGALGQGG
jgi:phage-related protein